jgi:glycosyltransferase involved in cell wall biosynthesis
MLMRFSIGPVGRFDAAVLHWSLTGATVPMLIASDAVGDLWTQRQFNPADVFVVPPAVDCKLLEHVPRNAIRRQWRDEFGVDDDTFIVGLIGEPVSWPDARMAVEIVARVALSGRRVRIALQPAAARRVEAMTLLRRLDMIGLAMGIDELAEPWRVMNGLDAALALGVDFRAIGNAIRSAPSVGRAASLRRVEPHLVRRPHPSISPVLWACAAGVPVIAHDLPSLRGIIEHERTGLLVNEHDMNAASDHIARLHDDSALRNRISVAAIDMINSRFTPQTLCDHMEQACEDAVNEQALQMRG